MSSPTDRTDRRSRLRRISDRAGEVADSTYRYRLLMYVALVLWTSFLFWRIQEDREDGRIVDAAITADLLEEVDQEAIARDYTICARSNADREAILGFVEALIMSDDGVVDPGEQRALDLAQERFAKEPCPPNPVADPDVDEENG